MPGEAFIYGTTSALNPDREDTGMPVELQALDGSPFIVNLTPEAGEITVQMGGVRAPSTTCGAAAGSGIHGGASASCAADLRRPDR
jgi:hypothetical protein